MNVWEEILRQPAFPLPLQLFPQMKYIQGFVSSVMLHFVINVVTSWGVCLAPETALSCVALILSQSRNALVCPRLLGRAVGELSAMSTLVI